MASRPIAASAAMSPKFATQAKLEVKSDKSQHPTPTPEDGKALIYVVADGHVTTIFGVDGSGWVPSTVERTSSCQSAPANTMSVRCCNRFLHRKSSLGSLESQCIRYTQSQAEHITSSLAWSRSVLGSFFN